MRVAEVLERMHHRHELELALKRPEGPGEELLKARDRRERRTVALAQLVAVELPARLLPGERLEEGAVAAADVEGAPLRAEEPLAREEVDQHRAARPRCARLRVEHRLLFAPRLVVNVVARVDARDVVGPA